MCKKPIVYFLKNQFKIKGTIKEIFLNEGKIENFILPTNFENIYIIPSNQNLKDIELQYFNNEEPGFILYDALQQIKAYYDFTLLDTPPSLGLATKKCFNSYR